MHSETGAWVSKVKMQGNVKIIFENEQLLVVDKPTGLMVHGDGKSDEYTLSDWLAENYPELKEVGEPWRAQNGEAILRPGIVHRLDKETSGVLLVAKTQDYFAFLKNKFKNREMQKEYRAFVYGGFKDEKSEGIINKKIGRSKNFGTFTTEPFARGTLREALTEYKVIKQTGESQEGDFAYLALSPKTGRTHQLRVHLKSIHRPIVCDKLYAPKRKCMLNFERLALHAHKIALHDIDGRALEFTADLPEDFQFALQGF